MPVDCLQLHVFDCQLGWFGLLGRGGTLRQLTFGHRSGVGARRAMLHLAEDATFCPKARELGEPLRGLVERLCGYAAGEVVEFEDVPVDLDHLKGFALRVIRRCRALRYGETLEYGELARRAGSPGAARAVGRVMAQNCTPLIVPCHRVVAAGGRLGGFSAAGGIKTKRQLLVMEAVAAQQSSVPLACR